MCKGERVQIIIIPSDIQIYFVFPDIEVACYNYEGIDAVKNALRAGIQCSTEDMPIKVMPYSFLMFLS